MKKHDAKAKVADESKLFGSIQSAAPSQPILLLLMVPVRRSPLRAQSLETALLECFMDGPIGEEALLPR